MDGGGAAEGTGAGAGEIVPGVPEAGEIVPGVSEAEFTEALKTGRVRGTISRYADRMSSVVTRLDTQAQASVYKMPLVSAASSMRDAT